MSNPLDNYTCRELKIEAMALRDRLTESEDHEAILNKQIDDLEAKISATEEKLRIAEGEWQTYFKVSEELGKKLALSKSWVKHHQECMQIEKRKTAIAIDALKACEHFGYVEVTEALKKLEQ